MFCLSLFVKYMYLRFFVFQKLLVDYFFVYKSTIKIVISWNSKMKIRQIVCKNLLDLKNVFYLHFPTNIYEESRDLRMHLFFLKTSSKHYLKFAWVGSNGSNWHAIIECRFADQPSVNQHLVNRLPLPATSSFQTFSSNAKLFPVFLK